MLADTTVDPGIADDILAAYEEDSSWYGVILDQAGKAEIAAAATQAVAIGRLPAFTTSDGVAFDGNVTTDAGAVAKAASQKAIVFATKGHDSTADAGALGRLFPYTPGSIALAHKSLANVTAEKLSKTEIETAVAKGYNVYATIQGANIAWEGRTASGDWIDIVIGLAALDVDVKVSIFEYFLSLPKVPFTQEGIDGLKNVLNGVLYRWAGAPYNFIDGNDPDNPITITMPELSAMTAAQRNNRAIPDILFSFRFQGAIIKATLTGFGFP